MKKIRFSDSLNHAVQGIAYALKTERNLKIHITVAICALIMSLWLDIDRVEFMMITMAMGFVIVTEILNTSIEAVVNLFTISSHPLAKVAKDMAAGAVLTASMIAAACAYLVILPAIKRPVVIDVVSKIKDHSIHIIVILVVLILITVAIFKAVGGKGTFTRGGLASGHAALAFAASTAILLITRSIVAGTLAIGIALLVAQSRVEANFHKLQETIVGALVGVLLTMIIFAASAL